MTQRFGQNIRTLMCAIKPYHLHNTTENLVIHIMKLTWNVARHLCEVEINFEFDSFCVITKHHCLQLKTYQIFQNFNDPHCLTCTGPQSHVLWITCWSLEIHPIGHSKRKKIYQWVNLYPFPPQFSSQKTSKLPFTSLFLKKIPSSRVDDKYLSRCFSAVQWYFWGPAKSCAR